MTSTVESALSLWGLEGASWRLVATRENQVFRVDHDGHAYALRLHRPGYSSNAELRSELQWTHAVQQGGIQVPAPIASLGGEFLQTVDGYPVDVLTWLSGTPISDSGLPQASDDRRRLFRDLGREMARLHEITDAWEKPEGFTRRRWDRDGLLGDAPVWGRFWDNPALSGADRELFLTFRDEANAQLAAIENTLDFGLIHADLVRENLLVDGHRLQLIDFDDSGWGFRVFDLATTLLRNQFEPDYLELKAALLEGYLSVRNIELEALDLFMVLRAATYVGWIVPRMKEEGSLARNERFISTTRSLTQNYLAH